MLQGKEVFFPEVRTGFNEKWRGETGTCAKATGHLGELQRGESGYGEFRRVEGFSIFVDTQNAMVSSSAQSANRAQQKATVSKSPVSGP